MKRLLDRELNVQNAITGNQYIITPLHNIEPTQENLENIASICNEKLVYEWLFKELCDGKPYPIELAIQWLTWGADGWKNDTHYTYAVTKLNGDFVATVDIKSSNRERAEIGYWASNKHRGVITNALKKVIKIAEEVGFKTLYAEIQPNNERSIAVINRCGFHLTDRKASVENHDSYDRILSNNESTPSNQNA